MNRVAARSYKEKSEQLELQLDRNPLRRERLHSDRLADAKRLIRLVMDDGTVEPAVCAASLRSLQEDIEQRLATLKQYE